MSDMSSVMAGATEVVIDGHGPYECEIEVTQQVEMVRSYTAIKPDVGWEHTDSRGHFHAFAADGSLPTLREVRVHVFCDGSCGFESGCEGYDRAYYERLICGERVKPVFEPDHAARTLGVPVPGAKTTIITVHADRVLPEQKVSVRISQGDAEMIGIGDLRMTEADSDGRVTYEVFTRSLEPRMTPARPHGGVRAGHAGFRFDLRSL